MKKIGKGIREQKLMFTETEKNVPIEKVIKTSTSRSKKLIQKKKPIKNDLTNHETEAIAKNAKKMSQDNDLYKEKLFSFAVDTIIGVHPALKKEKRYFLNLLLNKRENETQEHILEKICINGKYYYIDQDGNIIDDSIDLVGVYTFDYVTKTNTYFIFSEIKKINIE